MPNKMTGPLIERQYRKARDGLSFLEQVLHDNKCDRSGAVQIYKQLLERCEDAREEVANMLVDFAYAGLRRKVEYKESGKQRRDEIKQEAIAKKVEQRCVISAPTFRGRSRSRTWESKFQHAFISITPELPDEEVDALLADKLALIQFVGKMVTPQRQKKFTAADYEWLSDFLKEIAKQRAKEARALEKVTQLQIQADKAASFDRMVMALDAIQVGGKLLGDCTGSDLIREAVKLEELSHEMTVQSRFYRELAKIVGKTVTVREAANRTGIVGLLTSHYKEDGVAA